MKNRAWKNWNVGEMVAYQWNDFDGKGRIHGRITEKHDDHLIVEADGMKLWCDDSTADMFSKYTHLTLGTKMVEIDLTKGALA